MRKKKTASNGANGTIDITEAAEIATAPVKTVKRTSTKGQHIHPPKDLMEQLDGQIDQRELLSVLSEVRNGNFTVRMPIDKIGRKR